MGSRSGRTIADANIDYRIVTKVLISADDGVALLILETHARAACGSRIKTIEILDGGNDRLSGVMRVDLNPHRNARTILVGILDQLKLDGAWNGGLVVLGLNELHNACVTAHGGENVGFRGSRGSMMLG